MTNNWRDEYIKTMEASKSNNQLYRRYKELGRLQVTENPEKFNQVLTILDTESRYVSDRDLELGASSWELNAVIRRCAPRITTTMSEL